MVVLHVQVPRELSFSVRPWRRELFGGLASSGVSFEQVDLNLDFWRWLLDGPGADAFGRLRDLEYQGSRFNRDLIHSCAERVASVAMPSGAFTLGGLQLATDVTSCSTSMRAWAQSEEVQQFWSPWLRQWEERLTRCDVLAFGVGSHEELAAAAVISGFVNAVAPNVHTTLAHHRWENFSLGPRLERLVRSGDILQMFDSVVVQEERASDALAGLARVVDGGPLSALTNVAVRLDGESHLCEARCGSGDEHAARVGGAEASAIARYLASTGLPPDRLLMLDSFVRNDCYYGRCTFCVQNVGYSRHQHFKHAAELQRSLGLMRHLAEHHGVRAFSFVDQAVPVPLLDAICENLTGNPVPARWCFRTLPDTMALTAPLLDALASVGCAEVLLGVESTLDETLRRMGKPHDFRGAHAHEWIRLCRSAGIDCVLSGIRAFPTETDEEYESGTGAFLRECSALHDNVTIIENRFALFDGSAMAASPHAFGIREVFRRGHDMESALDYVDIHGRDSRRPTPPQPRNREAERHVHYSSIGLLYRWGTGRWLADDLQADLDGWPFPQTRDTLVLGSNGYLGSNLQGAIEPNRLILSSRAVTPRGRCQAPYVAADLTQGSQALAGLAPRVVFLCSRPYTNDYAEHAAFLGSVEAVLHRWAEQGHLRRLVFFSTQLVASTPLPGTRVDGSTSAAPEEPYSCAKAQLEVFAAYLARRFQISVDIVRLPLLWGGQWSADDEARQLLHAWKRNLAAGQRWALQSGDEVFGNSWVDVDDLIRALVVDPGPGFRIRTATSGDFTYAALQRAWGSGAPSGQMLPLIRSTFILVDELGLPRRGSPTEWPPTIDQLKPTSSHLRQSAGASHSERQYV